MLLHSIEMLSADTSVVVLPVLLTVRKSYRPMLLKDFLRESFLPGTAFRGWWIKLILLSSFSHLSVASPMSQLILKPFRPFTYVTAHSPTLPLLHLCHSSFSNPSVASATSQFILQPFRPFTYVTAHSPTLPSLYLRHCSFSNPSVVLPTSQFILQPFFRFSYVTSSSLNWAGEPPMLWTTTFPLYLRVCYSPYSCIENLVFRRRPSVG